MEELGPVMLYQIFDPPPILAPYVRFFWALEADVAPGEEFVHRTLADGCVEMVFHYRTAFDEINDAGRVEPSPLSSIQAQSTTYRRFAARSSFGIFGAYLYPFAIPRLFSLPASDLTDISPDLYSVFGYEGRVLDDQVISAADNSERVRVVSRFLENGLARAGRDLPAVHHAVRTILDQKGIVSVAALAERHSLSVRQFERKFKELAGLPPKLYSRIARFQAAVEQKAAGSRDLTEIAYDHGYYDQSHFISDFRQFSGYTPKQYFWDQAEGTQYLASA